MKRLLPTGNSFSISQLLRDRKQSSGPNLDSLGDHAHESGILSMATLQLDDLQRNLPILNTGTERTVAFENAKSYAASTQACGLNLHYPDGPQKP